MFRANQVIVEPRPAVGRGHVDIFLHMYIPIVVDSPILPTGTIMQARYMLIDTEVYVV